MDMNNIDWPKTTEISHAIVVKSWMEAENRNRDKIPIEVEILSKYIGKTIWECGYYPEKTTFQVECEQYDQFRSLGIFCDVKMEKTYAQRFYPLYRALKECVEELKKIKASRWYKFFTFIGVIKSPKD